MKGLIISHEQLLRLALGPIEVAGHAGSTKVLGMRCRLCGAEHRNDSVGLAARRLKHRKKCPLQYYSQDMVLLPTMLTEDQLYELWSIFAAGLGRSQEGWNKLVKDFTGGNRAAR